MATYSHRVSLDDGTWAEVYYLSPSDLVAIADIKNVKTIAAFIERIAPKVIECHGPVDGQPFVDQPLRWHTDLITAWDRDEAEEALPPA